MKVLTPFTLLLLFISAISLLIVAHSSSFVSAMHEDEAGKYDWVAQRVGTPTSAFIHKKNIFVASHEANTVASLSRKDGHPTWRRVFGQNDDFACVMPLANSVTGVTTVVAVTKTGFVHFLRGKDGATAANPIALSSGSAIQEVFACSNVESTSANTISAAVFASSSSSVASSLNVFKIDVETESSQAFAPKISLLFDNEQLPSRPIAASVTSGNSAVIALQDGSYTWIELKSGAKFAQKFEKLQGSKNISSLASIATEGKSSRSAAFLRDDDLVFSAQSNKNLAESTNTAVSVTCNVEKKAIEVGGVLVETIPCDQCSHSLKSKYSTVRVLAVADGENTPNGDASAPEPFTAVLFTTKTDGAAHFVVINTQKKAVVKSWSLLHEGLAFPKDIALESTTSATASSKFAISTHVFVLSRYNRLYKLARGFENTDYPAIVFNKKVTCCKDPAANIARVDEQTGNVVIKTVSGKEVVVNGENGEVLVGGCGSADSASASENKKPAGSYYDINRENGQLVGYEVLATSGERVDTWRVRIAGKINAVAADHNLFAISSVEHYRGVPNRTAQTTEIRRRFPMANVILVAFTDSVGALTVAALDSLTGTTLTSTRHADCGAFDTSNNNNNNGVHLVVAENTVIYHFFNRAKRRYYVATWELFEHQTQVLLETNMVSPALIAQSLVAKRRQFNSAVVRAPHVVASVRHFHQGPVAVLGVTHTSQSIARKLVIFVLPSGEALSVALIGLWGAPVKMPDPKNDAEMSMANSLIIGSFDRLTNVNRVARPTMFKSAPSRLESTSRIVVAGLDLWYVPTSAGKPFDRLDDEFNKKGLIMVCCLLPILALVLRYFAIRRSVNVAWS